MKPVMSPRGVNTAGEGFPTLKGLPAESKGDSQLPLGSDDLPHSGRLLEGRSRTTGAFFVYSLHHPQNTRDIEINSDLISTIRLIGCLGKLSWIFKYPEN